MKRKELLEFMKNKIDPHYYEGLEIWTDKRKKHHIFFDREFDVAPIFMNGFCVSTGDLFDFVHVYPEYKKR